jgi:hypothetical protein
MATIILELRGMTDAGTADFTAGTVTYWTDDHLQTILDRNVRLMERTPLVAFPRYDSTGGTLQYFEYRSTYGNIESGTPPVFGLSDGSGSAVGTSGYTADYTQGVFTFTADQGGTSYYLTGRSYDLNMAAGAVYRQKAAKAASYFDFSTDNHSVKRSALVKQYLSMAEYYESQSGMQVIPHERGDYAA